MLPCSWARCVICWQRRNAAGRWPRPGACSSRAGRYSPPSSAVMLPWATEYPYVGYGVIPALEALARLGYTRECPRVALALEYLLSQQLPDGSWPWDRSAPRPAIDAGQPGAPHKWLTLDALRVVKWLSRD